MIMKKMRKIFAIALAVTVAMTMGIATAAVSFAADPAGTITIDNAVNGQKYTAYKVFDVTYDSAKTTYNYKITSDSAFYDTVSAFAAVEANGMTLTRVGTTSTYNVRIDETKFTAAKAAEFAAALAADTTKPAGQSATASGGSAVIEVSSLGYYFVETSTGALCSLNTTDNNATIKEKNSVPTLSKEVQEDSSGTYGQTASADIGQAVYFKLTVNTGTNENAPGEDKGTGVNKDYIVEDTLPNGVDYISTTSVTADGTTWTEGTDYTVSVSGKIITYTFKAASVGTLGQNKDIVVEYKAKLNGNAVIASTGNTNTAKLSYGKYTDEGKTATLYTYALALDKFNSEGDNLPGAVFTFPFTATQVQAGSDRTPAIYKVTNAASGTTDITTPESGVIVVIGLDEGTYTVSEKKPPEGYNELTGDLSIQVKTTSTATADKTFTTTKSKTVTFTGGTDDGGYQIHADSIVGVENLNGTKLPSTGGMGTTIFYILGALLVIGCGVILIARRRMNAK